MNGTAITGGGLVAGLGTDCTVAGNGDHNGDGKSDTLLRSDSSGSFREYQMNGTTISGGGTVTSASADWASWGRQTRSVVRTTHDKQERIRAERDVGHRS